MTTHTKEFIRSWDPLQLQALDESLSEYDGLAFDLFLWYKKNRDANSEVIARQLYGLLSEWTGDEQSIILEEVLASKADLHQALDADMQSEVA